MSAMIKILWAFGEICVLRRAPQDLPASHLLLGFALLTYAGLAVLLSNMLMPTGPALVAAALDTLMLAALPTIALWVRLYKGRLIQVMTALMGSGAILELVALPAMAYQQQSPKDDSMILFPSLLILGILFWQIVIFGHILRHALSTTLVVGMVTATAYIYISQRVLTILFLRGG